MRVCHVSPHLPPDQGANAILPAQIGSWAVARGDEVSFVSHPRSQHGIETDALPAPVRWVPRRAKSGGLTGVLRIDTWRAARAIAAALDASAARADLLHLHSNGLIVETAANWAARRGIPTILTLYGTEIWHYRRRWPIDPFARAYTRAAAVTFYSQQLLVRARELGLDRPALSVVPPAVADAFAPQDDATRRAWKDALGLREPIVLLNVKRLHELAGQRFLIDAFARIARGRDDVRLVICGTGPLRQALDDQARASGASAKITFAGLLRNDDVARYTAVADLFVLPSLLEAMPTVAVEALASGTPVISADHPGGVELHGLFGEDVAVVPKANADLLADALLHALAHPRRTMAKTEAIIRERFRPAAVDAAYRRVYESALAGPRARTSGGGSR